MQIDPRTREYLMWTVRSAPTSATFDVSFDEGGVWHPLEVDGTTLRVLVRGPDAIGPAGTAVLLPYGRSIALVRATTSSQAIIRIGGAVDIES